ncbi:hypothetical protein SDC9_192479 [bioreactor metagenome]|uniref:Uncharacterized protein n=1 Tax=bioreactor metagenome TaxID=1076179 RepID=A0A645I2D8_9ZZZZ
MVVGDGSPVDGVLPVIFRLSQIVVECSSIAEVVERKIFLIHNFLL